MNTARRLDPLAHLSGLAQGGVHDCTCFAGRHITGLLAPAEPTHTNHHSLLSTSPRSNPFHAAAEMAHGKTVLEPYMKGLNEKEKTAVLMTWYKQGPSYVERYLKNRATGQSTGPIKPGEGIGIFRDHQKFTDVLR